MHGQKPTAPLAASSGKGRRDMASRRQPDILGPLAFVVGVILVLFFLWLMMWVA